ncbi:MAG: sigma-70 family RNA polymerase sigma factor [Maribacter sp.]|nr:sigma-70 family RNA polymerase sigma factor [Maribacter sp.]
MKDIVNYSERTKEFHLFVANSFSDLAKFKKEQNKTAFNALLMSVLPEVKRYINKRLTTAVSKGNMSKGKYKPDDFIDQLYIEVYDHFDTDKNKKDLHPWLFNIADKLLEDALVEEEFDALFLQNIDEYSKPERDEMVEKYSTDGDGDLVMIDELDDISYPKNDYILKNVFIEDESQEMVAKLDKELGQENIRKHAENILKRLPKRMRIAFELYTEHQFDLWEITKIMNRDLEEVQQLLENARKILETSFKARLGMKDE